MRSLGRHLLPLLLLSALPVSVLGGDVLSTDGFSTCDSDPSIQVQKLNVSYNRNTKMVTFDVAGSSSEEQKVKLSLVVTAYGKEVYSKNFDPCDNEYNVTQMCPVPAGTFASQGEQSVPAQYASQIPAIAFAVPDLDGLVKLEVMSEDGTKALACITSSVGNGRTISMPGIKSAAAGIAAGALAISAVTALASGGVPGATSPSPSFGDVIGWFQSMATNGMLSVQYPKVYQSFTTNFGFSTGLIPWGQMQTAIDNFRAETGGNTTDNNYEYLKNNVTLRYNDGESNSTLSKRALNAAYLYIRDGTTIDVNGTTTSTGDGSSSGNSTSSSTDQKDSKLVSGIQAYSEQLSIPSSNTFMTLLLIWAIVVASIIVLILLAKAILEAWAQCGTLSKYFESWRKRYWWRLAKALTNLCLLLYGVWTLWCIYQFTEGDSWAAKILAATTLALFTAVLVGFSYFIFRKAHQYKKLEGAADKLYDDKDTWLRYSLFYDNYKKSCWWMFVPAIIYTFARSCVIAGANGHGMIQVIGQLIVEGLMLGLLLWTRPYQRRSGKWIALTIQTVRVISVVCVLVFVEELGISQTTKTVTGVVLIVVQTVLTAVLALLIAINAIITCVRENPHRRRRKQAEKMNRDLDNLTPLDARNSLLMDNMSERGPDSSIYKAPIVAASPFSDTRGRYNPVQNRSDSPGRYHDDEERLVSAAAPFEQTHSRSPSRESRQPRLPDLNFGRAL